MDFKKLIITSVLWSIILFFSTNSFAHDHNLYSKYYQWKENSFNRIKQDDTYSLSGTDDANFLLTAALGGYNGITTEKAEDLIAKALDNGARFDKSRICDYDIHLSPSTKLVNLILKDPDNSINVRTFLHWIVGLNSELRDSFIDIAFAKGAHPNMLLGALFADYNFKIAERVNLMRKALDKGARFDETSISFFHDNTPPSLEEANIMFEDKNNSINPDEFLSLVSSIGTRTYGRNGKLVPLTDELSKLQDKLLDLAFANGAGLSKIGFFTVPTQKTCEKLIEHGMKPDDLVKKLANLMSIVRKKNDKGLEDIYLNIDIIERRNALIEFLVTKGAQPVKPDDSWTSEIIYLWRKINSLVSDDRKYYDCNESYFVLLNNNVTNDDGKTLLMLFAENGNFHIVKHLLNDGVNPNKRDINGKTALMLAEEAGYSEIAELLRKKESSIGEKSDEL